MDDENVDMFDDLGGDAGGADAGSDSGEAGTDAPPPKESKRISDLMSAAQKAQARANKAEARVKALEAAKSESGSQSDDTAPARDERDEERQEWVSAQREFLRERALNSDARLEEYGISADDIAGSTPAEIKASVKRYQALIDAVETKARNRLLLEYGLNPEIAGQAMDPKVDIGAMSDDDFEKLVQKTKGY